MEDLELCKRVAEIEGLNIRSVDGDIVWIGDGEHDEYNPLTNKALLFDLMVKYNVCIDRGFAGIDKGLAEIWPKELSTCDLIGTYHASFENDEEIPRAILTTIVEANTQ